MRRYRRLLNISYKDHVTNEEVRGKIQAAIGEYDEFLTLVKKRKLRWFGHVSMSSGLAKTILQGTVKGKRKRGRQKKRWEDNVKEWTGMDFASSTRAAENRSRCSHPEMSNSDKTETLVTIGDLTYVREVSKLTSIVVCVYISSLTQFAYFLRMIELVSLLSNHFNAFKA